MIRYASVLMIFAMIAFSENGAFRTKKYHHPLLYAKNDSAVIKAGRKIDGSGVRTGYSLSLSVIDHTCLSICEEGVHGKQAYLSGMCHTISQRNKDSLFVDSFKLENAIVHLYGNTSVVTFVVHSYRKSRGIPNERKTRFYDVWVTRKAG